MGNKNQKGIAKITTELEARCGKIPLSGRYHKLPHKMEDDYEVTRRVLGSGYSGVVRLAKSRVSGLSCAVKAFKLSSIAADKREQLQDEIAIHLAMDHPHVTRLYDVYEGEDYLHLVMECMEGGELYDRVTEKKRFSELDAAEAVWQMLLSLNYIHSHGIVHRDLKLENFLYDKKGSDHLKLIDFGFSKMWDPNIKMHVSCGTLSYVAPEVLEKSYTSQCDLWSLGVIAFILLAGYMPFSGNEDVQTRNIATGRYKMKPERWANVSQEATDFVKRLLQVDPNKRLTAEKALEHRWMTTRHKQSQTEIGADIVDALRRFGHASKFRRACLEMMAWSLSNEDRAKVRQYFLEIDTSHRGTITLAELKKLMTGRFNVPNEEIKQIFHAMDYNHDEEIHYSDFLAAMVSTRIALHDDLLRTAFHKFDTDNSGYITVEKLRQVLGDSFDGDQVELLLKEADQLKDNRISYPEFVAYLKEQPLDAASEAVAQVIDKNMREQPGGSDAYIRGEPGLVLHRIKSPGSSSLKNNSLKNNNRTGASKKKPPSQTQCLCVIS